MIERIDCILQLDTTPIQLQVFPPQRKLCKCVYIRGTKSRPMNGSFVHNMNKKDSPATRSSGIMTHCHNCGTSS